MLGGAVGGTKRAPRNRARLTAPLMALVLLASVVWAGVAKAEIVRGPDGHSYGVYFQRTPAGRAELRAAQRRFAAAHAQPLKVGEAQDPLQYFGGPLMTHDPINVHAIFWGPKGSFAPGADPKYRKSIVQYLQNVAADSGKPTNEYSVVTQYTDGDGTTGNPVSDQFQVDAVDDTKPYSSAPTATDHAACSGKPVCLTDRQIQAEIASQITKHHWPLDTQASPRNVYVVFTDAAATVCRSGSPSKCSSIDFCAYHGTAARKAGHAIVYAVVPFQPLFGCWQYEAPGGVSRHAAAALDSLAHELTEAATDPEVSLSSGFNAPLGWADASGGEVADKCIQFSEYFPSLGGGDGTLFNQLSNGHPYWLQTIWSNAPLQTPASDPSSHAGCAARLGPTPDFSNKAALQPGSDYTFDGSHSYDIQSPITVYSWDFDDGSLVDTSSGAMAHHTFTNPGTYDVTLKVTDATGAANASTRTVTEPVTVRPLATTVPANDDFANAQTLSGLDDIAQANTTLATAETGEPDHAGNAGGHSVWYRWTAPVSGAVDFLTCAAGFDTVLAAYTGQTLGALTPVASNDNSSFCVTPTGSLVAFNAVSGTTYRIAIDGAPGQTGFVQLQLVGQSELSEPTTKITKLKIHRHKATLSFRGHDPAPASPPLALKCKIDKKPYSACAQSKSYGGLSSGKHTFSVFAADAAGNGDETAAVKKFKIS
jgi:PKD repeat protein